MGVEAEAVVPARAVLVEEPDEDGRVERGEDAYKLDVDVDELNDFCVCGLIWRSKVVSMCTLPNRLWATNRRDPRQSSLRFGQVWCRCNGFRLCKRRRRRKFLGVCAVGIVSWVREGTVADSGPGGSE